MTNNPNNTNLTSTNSRLLLAAIGWRREHHQPMRKERIMTSITRRNALVGAGAAAGAIALAGPALAKAPSQAMTLWHEWMAAYLAHAPAMDGPNFEEADIRWDRAGEAILNLSDGTPEAVLVKLAVAIDWIDNCTDPSEHLLEYSAYNELSSITGLDPLAELNKVRASQA